MVGGGAWGTVLADMLARKGETVVLWAREPEVVASVNSGHVNQMFLPDATLAPALGATGDLAGALDRVDVVVSAAPSHAVRGVMAQAAPALPSDAVVVSVSKGLEAGTEKTMSQVLRDVLPAGARVAVLSGPSFAREVYEQQPTAVVAAAHEERLAREAQRVFSCGHFRVYTQTDVVGVELAGALKNVIALAVGILEGLGLGLNARAALITRGLAEITRLGVRVGADPRTFAGLAGMGDLILTSTGDLSRNRALGVALGRGESMAQALEGKHSVAEAVNTAKSAVALADRNGVELPIAREVTEILFRGKPARRAVADLMERALKPEHWQ